MKPDKNQETEKYFYEFENFTTLKNSLRYQMT